MSSNLAAAGELVAPAAGLHTSYITGRRCGLGKAAAAALPPPPHTCSSPIDCCRRRRFLQEYLRRHFVQHKETQRDEKKVPRRTKHEK
jgi:hypothetical protein